MNIKNMKRIINISYLKENIFGGTRHNLDNKMYKNISSF